MSEDKVIHFIFGEVQFKNFLLPIVNSSSSFFENQEIVIDSNTKLTEENFDPVKNGKFYFINNFKLKVNVISLLISFFVILKLIFKSKPTILVAHMSLTAPIPLLVAKILNIKKRVYMCHGSPYLGYSGITRFFLLLIEKINLSLSTSVISVSPSIKRELKEISKNTRIFSTIPGSSAGLYEKNYATNEEIYKKIQKKEINNDQLNILYVGRPHKRKGVYDLIEAVKLDPILSREVIINIVGFERNQLDKKIEIPDNMIFHGFQQKINQYYFDNDIVILPSWHEGFGYALLEGAAFGCALIASDIPGPDSILIDGFNGSFVQVKSPDSIKNCILNYHNKKDLLLNHMKNSYEVSKKFEQDLIVNQVLGFIKN